MKKDTRKSVSSDLRVFDILAKEHDFIEATEWANGEGYDITINDRIISLTHGQLSAINYLTQTLEYDQSLE